MRQQSEILTGCDVVWSAGHIKVSGEIDLANAPVIERRIRGLLGAENIEVDCRAVTFLDVAGLRMLTRLGLAAVAAGVMVRLRSSPAVSETLRLCGERDLPGVVLLDRADRDSPVDHDTGGPR